MEGLKATVGKRGRTKLAAKSAHASVKDYEDAAEEIAIKQRDDLLAGKMRFIGAKGVKKAEDAVKKEMHRLARVDGDAVLKAAGYKVTKIKADMKNALAEKLIASDPEKYRKAAEASLSAAAALKTPEFAGLNLEGFIPSEAKKTPRKKKAAEPAGTTPPPPTTRGRGQTSRRAAPLQ